MKSIPLATAKAHFGARISMTAGVIQAPAVLVKTGSICPQQQTFVKSAIWELSTLHGSGGTQAAHIVPGGLYIVHYPGTPRFGPLLRRGYREDKLGYLVTPMYESAVSPQGRQLISTQMTATTVLPSEVNRIELAAEGTRGNQLPCTAGEKTAFEQAVSVVKTGAPGRTLGQITSSAILQMKSVCATVIRKLTKREQELRIAERRSIGAQHESIQLQREVIDLKLNVTSNPEEYLDWGQLAREATLLYDYEMAAQSDQRLAVQDAVNSYGVEKGTLPPSSLSRVADR